MSALRVLLADDHPLILSALRLVIERMGGVEVVAEARDGREAVALAARLHPNLVVMDISMRELNGIEAMSRIRAEAPDCRVLILSSHTTEEFVHRALKAGAAGYVVKDSAPSELSDAIRAVMRGEAYLSPAVSAHVVSGIRRGHAAQESGLDRLTSRQREILQMIAEGNSTKEIAHSLGLGVKTVESHRASLMDRLDIRDVAGLVLFAVRHGLVSAGPRE